MRGIYPSDKPMGRRPSTVRMTVYGVHAIDTEARSLDQAVDIIRFKQNAESASKRMRGRKPTLRQEFSLAKGRAIMQKMHGKVSLAGGLTSKQTFSTKKEKTPHPFRDPPEDRQRKCIEMYGGGDGHWGWGPVAYRRLAKVFGVTVGQIIDWLKTGG